MLPKEVGRDFKVLRDTDIRSSRTRSPTAQMFIQPLSDTCISKIVEYQKNNSANESHQMTTRENTLEPKTHDTTSVHTGQQQRTIHSSTTTATLFQVPSQFHRAGILRRIYLEKLLLSVKKFQWQYQWEVFGDSYPHLAVC
jgi:hypothetical protein